MINDIEIEYNGIKETILSVSRDPYIVGYLNHLEKSIKDKDLQTMSKLLTRLCDWYDENINKIMSNQYISNKKLHLKTKELISNYLSDLKVEDESK